jgi:1A family penicillin-binding protein
MARLTQSGAAPPRAQQRTTAARFVWRLVLAFVKLTLLSAGLALLAAFGVYHYYGRDLPDPQQIGRYRPAETSRIYARDGRTLLLELVDPRGGRRTVVPFDQIPQALKDATVAVEDADFYRNPGVDLRGILRALLQNYEAGEVVSGGSTITQQLVRNVLLPPEDRTRITIERKLREAILAFRVSREYSKDQILALYLNEVYYGNLAYGVEAAAQSYFGKHVWELTPPEATMIAGLPQSPTLLNPLTNLEGARERQRVTLDLMVKNGYLAPGQAEAILHAPLAFAPQETSVLAPHFTFYVRQLLEERYGPEVLYRGGLRIVTSIDLYWQGVAEDIVRRRIRDGAPAEGYGPLSERNATNAGAVMLAPDGQILAMVGSVDYHDQSIDGQVNVTLAPRQPGSALKPVVYAAALQRGWTPATVIWDTPVQYPGAGEVYAPRNYDGQFHGPQRLRMALANSLNIPAVRTLEFVGVEPFVELAHRMGITTLNDPARYGLPLALGAGEVRLLDLANVYTTIRNGGRFREPVAVLAVTNARGEVLEQAGDAPGRQALGERGEQVAYLLTDILSDNTAREFMFGPGNVMELPDGRPAAVKTGTSNEWRDSWAVGFTPDITVGVWVGNSDNTPMEEVAGSNGAGTIWRAIMTTYHAGRPIRAFERPPGVSEATICALTGGPAVEGCPNPIAERFVAGTEPQEGGITLATVRVGGDGTCLAASYTPPDQVRVVTFAVYPPEFREWAQSAGAPQPPTAYCPPPASGVAPGPALPGTPAPSGAVAQIAMPAAGATITATQVLVRGTSRGAYVLDYGAGREPSEWRPIAQGGDVPDGILGVWEAALPPGEYTLRLRVTTIDGVPVETRATVQVGP